jgi:MOSC domain-containing protein YiiM
VSDATPIRIKHLFVSPGHNFFGHHGQPAGEHPMIERAEIRCVAGRGIEGDRFFDFKSDYKGQVTFFANEVYEQLCAEFGVWDKPSSVFRRNIITAGADLSALIGREFEIQGVRFFGTAECAPCEWMNVAFAPGAEEWLKGRGGLRAKILTDGVLRAAPVDSLA